MARVEATIERIELETDEGRIVPSVRATCSQCDEQTESFGRDIKSIRRCLVLLKENCPLGEDNFYTCDETED